MSEIINSIIFNVSSMELSNILSAKAKEKQDKADACGRLMEAVSTEAYHGFTTDKTVPAVIVKAACELIEETYREDGLPSPDRFMKIMKRYRDDFLMQANSYTYIANHVIPNAVYRLTNEELQKLGVIEWPRTVYGDSLCKDVMLMKAAMER